MRPSACLGLILFATGGCAQIPELVRVDVDGSTLEFKKKPAPPAVPPATPPATSEPGQPLPPPEPPPAPDAGPR